MEAIGEARLLVDSDPECGAVARAHLIRENARLLCARARIERLIAQAFCDRLEANRRRWEVEKKAQA